MYWIAIILITVALVVSVSVLFIKNTMSAVIVTGVVSLIASLVFLVLAAPDVAITEAAVGAALTMVIFVVALSRTKTTGDKK